MKVKRILALLMSTIMVVGMLAACGNSGSSETNSSASESETDVPQSVEKVVMGFLGFSVPSAEGEAAVEAAINEITREKIGVEVDLLIMDGMSYAQQMTLMLSGNEQLDIFNCIAMGFTSVVNNGYTLNLEENNLIQTYGAGAMEVMADYIDGCRFDGTLYGIPQNKDYASYQNGYIIAADDLDGIDYSYSAAEVNKITWDELENIMAQLHEAYPEKNTFIPQRVLVGGSIFCDTIGNDNFGVMMKPDTSLEISNLFTSPEYMEACQRIYRWNQMGYISGDAMTSDQGNTEAVGSNAGISYLCNIKAGVITQESARCGKPVVAFQIGEVSLVASSTASSNPWCINSNSEHPEAAMKLLNAFYTDPELANLLAYGIKDVDYVIAGDGHYSFPEGSDGKVGYHPNISWLMPNQFLTGVWEGNSLDVWEQTEAINKSAPVSKASGFMFDNAELSTEYAALTNIYDEYRDQIEFGFVDPEVAIPEMVQRMNNAGLEAYMAAKQQQLDDWSNDQ